MLRNLRPASVVSRARSLGVLVATVLLGATASAQSRTERPVYKDASAPVEQRVQDLLPKALAEGRITQADIDGAVARMLRLKFLTGMFEQPYADAKYAEAITDNAEARALALEAARKSVVLLKNDGVLPLRAAHLKTLAVIGPNAARIEMGGYSNVPTHVVTLLDGIKAKLGERVRVVSAEGVRLTDKGQWHDDEVIRAKPEENRARIKEAVQVARGADAIVLAIGGSSALHREAWAKNHLGDSATLDLTGEHGEFAIRAGSNSVDLKTATLTIAE